MTTWTADDVPDQRGRTVVVTGANSGLGRETTHALARAGARVVMACRSPDRARPIADGLGSGVVVQQLDLADLASVRLFAEELDADVDVLVNNAGVLAVPYGTTADGFELHTGVNHLGTFALTGLLIDRVRDRVVTVTSGLHRLGRLSTDLNWQRRRYRRWAAYMQSKLANLLFAYELDRRLSAAERSTLSVAAHPGIVATEGQRADTSLVGKVLAGGTPQPPAMGVLPILFAATSPDVRGGTCVGPDGFGQRTGYPVVVSTSKRSTDAASATALWRRSEELTGIRYPLPDRLA